MPEAVLAPGARIECRSAEWLVRSLARSSDGQQVVDVVGVSPFLREKEARFLVETAPALQPVPKPLELRGHGAGGGGRADGAPRREAGSARRS